MDLLIIILAVPLALMGLLGGLWLWQKMAESPIWEQIRKWMKIVGLCVTPALFAIVIFLVWMIKTKPPEFFRQFISLINISSWLLYFYMLGYDASILRPEPEPKK
jgi:cytochrome bd-type quinol oxidase subunit 2